MDHVDDGRVAYDKLCAMHFVTETGLRGRCIQDVVTKPHRKWARMQFENGHVEWNCAVRGGVDLVTADLPDGNAVSEEISKTRPDDFIAELTHIADALASGGPSPLDIERGLDTMLVIAAAHLSDQRKATVRINYDKGYTPAALEVLA